VSSAHKKASLNDIFSLAEQERQHLSAGAGRKRAMFVSRVSELYASAGAV
jgi:ClpP class serine protease